MNGDTLYYIFIGVLTIVFVGMIVYVKIKGKDAPATKRPNKPEAARSSETSADKAEKKPFLASLQSLVKTNKSDEPKNIYLTPSEKIIDIEQIVNKHLYLTKKGDLVAILRVDPVTSTTDVSSDNFVRAFVNTIASLEAKTTIQFVQMPLPSQVSGLTDRYAGDAYAWRLSTELALKQGNNPLAEMFDVRFRTSADIGNVILQVGSQAPRRESYVVMTKMIGNVFNGSVREIKPEKVREFEVQIQKLSGIFASNGISIEMMEPQYSLQVLWYAYNPDCGAMMMLEQSMVRYADIIENGRARTDNATVLTQDQIDEAIADPIALKRHLAPPIMDIQDTSVRFQHRTMKLYYVVDYKTGIPSIKRLCGQSGQFSHRLFVSYYITAPSPDEIALATRKAGTAQEALVEVAARTGVKPSYKQVEQVAAIEDARYGSETERDIPRMIAMYIGLICPNDPNPDEDDIHEFEATMRSAGMQFVPAQWLARDVWKTLIPLGQRHHIYEDRNVYSRDLATLNPVTSLSLFDPDGEFCGFMSSGEAALMPVCISRKRGEQFVPSDAIVGTPSSGKSFTLKFWMSDWASRSHRIFAVDPKMEFGPLTKTLGGKVLPLLGAKGFNLIHFDTIEDTSSQISIHLSNLMFESNMAAIEALYCKAKGLENTTISGIERNLLTNALKKAMTTAGMDPKNPTTWAPNKIFLSDVYQVLIREMYMEEPETIKFMRHILEQYADPSGQYFSQYNTPNDFNFDNDIITAIFGLSQFSDNTTSRTLASHFALRIASQHAIRSFLTDKEPRPFHIIIDEASQMLTTASLVSSVVRMLSLLPAYGISVHLAFQDIRALINADNLLGNGSDVESTNTLMGTIPAYWMFHQEPRSADLATKVLNLSDKDGAMIANMPKGNCILAFPRANLRIPLRIIVSKDMEAMFNTDAHHMKRIVNQMIEEDALV